MYTIRLELIGKREVDFLFAGCYGWGATRAKIYWKSAFCKGVGHYPPTFHVEGNVPTNLFARIDRQINALQLCRWQFHTKTLCSRSIRTAILHKKNGCFAFLSPKGATTMFILARWKARSRLPIRDRPKFVFVFVFGAENDYFWWFRPFSFSAENAVIFGRK